MSGARFPMVGGGGGCSICAHCNTSSLSMLLICLSTTCQASWCCAGHPLCLPCNMLDVRGWHHFLLFCVAYLLDCSSQTHVPVPATCNYCRPASESQGESAHQSKPLHVFVMHAVFAAVQPTPQRGCTRTEITQLFPRGKENLFSYFHQRCISISRSEQPPPPLSHLQWTLRLHVLSWDLAAGCHAGRDRDHEWQLLSLLAAHGWMCSHSKLQTPHSPAELRQSLGLRSRLPRPLHHQVACPVPHVSPSLLCTLFMQRPFQSTSVYMHSEVRALGAVHSHRQHLKAHLVCITS